MGYLRNSGVCSAAFLIHVCGPAFAVYLDSVSSEWDSNVCATEGCSDVSVYDV